MAAPARPRNQPTAPAKPKSDAYVALLAVALLAQIAACVFLYLDYSQYEGNKDPVKIAKELRSKADTPSTGAPAAAPPPPAAQVGAQQAGAVPKPAP
jgi:hypothetical protein